MVAKSPTHMDTAGGLLHAALGWTSSTPTPLHPSILRVAKDHATEEPAEANAAVASQAAVPAGAGSAAAVAEAARPPITLEAEREGPKRTQCSFICTYIDT